MAVSPVEVTLELTPRARFDIIDVRERLRAAHGDLLDVYPHHLYHSFHTTAGYLEQSLATRLTRETDDGRAVRRSVPGDVPGRRRLRARPARSPQGSDDRRSARSSRATPTRTSRSWRRASAPASATSIARRRPVCFVDLDGITDGRPRRRLTSIVGFNARARSRPTCGSTCRCRIIRSTR